MFKLRLDARQCLCCGICMDVCLPGAIALRPYRTRGLSGGFSYLLLNSENNPEAPPEAMMTFPYMAYGQACDGCRRCVTECPTGALVLSPFH